MHTEEADQASDAPCRGLDIGGDFVGGFSEAFECITRKRRGGSDGELGCAVRRSGSVEQLCKLGEEFGAGDLDASVADTSVQEAEECHGRFRVREKGWHGSAELVAPSFGDLKKNPHRPRYHRVHDLTLGQYTGLSIVLDVLVVSITSER